MKTLILAAAATLMTAPAFAQVGSGPSAAIAHFNSDLSGNEVVRIVDGEGAALSSRSGVVEVQAHFNKDFTGNDVRNLRQTVVSGTPAYGADIFAQIKAEGLEDE
jgi:hypothetical protein